MVSVDHDSGATAACYAITIQPTSIYSDRLPSHRRAGRTAKRKTPDGCFRRGLSLKSLAVTYSCMVEDHTTIGAERFHFRVRKGIGWFPLAMAARQTGP